MAQHAPADCACTVAGLGALDRPPGNGSRYSEGDGVADHDRPSAPGVSPKQTGRSPAHFSTALNAGFGYSITSILSAGLRKIRTAVPGVSLINCSPRCGPITLIAVSKASAVIESRAITLTRL